MSCVRIARQARDFGFNLGCTFIAHKKITNWEGAFSMHGYDFTATHGALSAIVSVCVTDATLWQLGETFSCSSPYCLRPWPHLISELYTSSAATAASQPAGSKRLVVVSQSSFIQLRR